MSTATRLKVAQIVSRIQNVIAQTVAPQTMTAIAQYTSDLVVKRTRLGYGVSENGGTKFAFPTLSTNYVKQRSRSTNLSDSTSPNKSNVTFTGQMLDSVEVIQARNGQITFGPTGIRTKGLSNLKLAGYLSDKGRPWLHVSDLEYNQVLRFYRQTFGDLLDKASLLR